MIRGFLLRVDFNPRSPRGGATYTRGLMVGFVPISIHAPHEGERRVGSVDKFPC